MKIVIDIPESIYYAIRDDEMLSREQLAVLEKHIYYSTLLPKGHGRLIDADALLTSERPNGIADDVWKESHICKLLSNAPTIIEVDKAESENKV